MPRHRLSLLIIVGVALTNLWVDYQLLLRNPEEQEAQLQRVLTILLPNYSPQVGRSEVEFLSGKLILYDVVLHEEDHPERRLVEIPRLEVEGDGFPLLHDLSLVAIEPTVLLRLDERGINLDLGGGGEAAEPLIDVHVRLRKGRLRFLNRLPDVAPGEGDLLVDDLSLDLDIAPDASFQGQGALTVSALVPPEHPLAAGAKPSPAIPDRRVLSVAPHLDFALRQEQGGAVDVGAHGTVWIGEGIRTLLPPLFQEKVWKVLGPRDGRIEAKARARLEESGAHVDVTLTPRDAAIVLEGFPVPITEINGGRFEVSAVVPREGDPELLAVTWEGIRARLEDADAPYERGRILGRGAVFPGREGEPVTIYVAAEVRELPLSESLAQAFPAEIREVYQRFSPRGVLPQARVQLFKGPYERDRIVKKDGSVLIGELQPTDSHEVLLLRDHRGELVGIHRSEVEEVDHYDAPAISIWVPQLGGSLSAEFQDVPIRVHDLQGHFTLREGPAVEALAEGRLEGGGTLHAVATVYRGELIHVDARAEGVPVGDGQRLVAALPPAARARVAPFGLHGGDLDVRVRVEKPAPDRPAQPSIDLTLRGVSMKHPEFPKLLTLDGRLDLVPRLDASEELERIEATLDLEVAGEGLQRSSARGTLVIPAEQPDDGIRFTSDIDLEVPSLDTRQVAVGPLSFLADIGSRGIARSVSAWVGGPTAVRARGRGRGLSVKLSAFPYRVSIDEFDVRLAGTELDLRRVAGRAPTRGRFEARGRVGLDFERPDAAADLDLRVGAEHLLVDADLMAALPAEVRGPLVRLRPHGPVSTPPGKSLRLLLRPGQPPVLQGSLLLEGVDGYVDQIHPDLAALSAEAVQGLQGTVRVEPRQIRIESLRGTFLGSPIEVEGSLDLPGPQAPQGTLGYEVRAQLEHLPVDARIREMAGPRAAEFFRGFPVEGPLELELHAFRAAGPGEEAHLSFLAHPLGMRVVPRALVPVPVVGVRGEVRLEDGEPVFLDVHGLLAPDLEELPSAPARLRVRRDASGERRFPDRGSAGRVFYVSIEDFQRPEDPRRRAAFERELPPEWLSTLSALNPTGRLDLEAWIYQPHAPRAPIRWVAEIELKEFGFTAGLRFEKIRGIVQADGRVAEFERASANGRLRLETLKWQGQTFRDLDGSFDLTDGVLHLGRAGAPFVGRLYSDGSPGSGVFKGVIEYAARERRYRGVLSLAKGSLAALMRDLDEWRAARRGRDLPTVRNELLEARTTGDDALVRRLEKELDRLLAKRKQLLTRIDRARAAADPERVARLQEELRALDGQSAGQRIPYQGELHAAVRFAGGGTDLKGRPIPLHGRGSVLLERANLLDVPALRIVKTLVTAARGQVTSSRALENMELEFDIEPDRIAIDRLRLSGKYLAVLARGGYVKFNGRLDLRLVPFDTEGIGYDILQWIPGTGYHFTGTLDDYRWRTLPSFLSPDWIRRALLPGGAEDD
ncbi:MAG: hypothetical protein D6731_06940 [Planctomycetota bacterium]|nr:MAG: hypothetical protein D6731_06940 [Planctomycetota bacterium]